MSADATPCYHPLERVGLLFLASAPPLYLTVLVWASTGNDLGVVHLSRKLPAQSAAGRRRHHAAGNDGTEKAYCSPAQALRVDMATGGRA
jgi:hypothetical protein